MSKVLDEWCESIAEACPLVFTCHRDAEALAEAIWRDQDEAGEPRTPDKELEDRLLDAVRRYDEAVASEKAEAV